MKSLSRFNQPREHEYGKFILTAGLFAILGLWGSIVFLFAWMMAIPTGIVMMKYALETYARPWTTILGATLGLFIGGLPMGFMIYQFPFHLPWYGATVAAFCGTSLLFLLGAAIYILYRWLKLKFHKPHSPMVVC